MRQWFFLSFLCPVFSFSYVKHFVVFLEFFDILSSFSCSVFVLFVLCFQRFLLRYSFFLIIYFNWRMITFQYCDFFCHTSTWISHRCTYVPLSWNPLHPPSPPHPSGLSQSTGFECPASCIKLALVICFTYGNIYVSLLNLGFLVLNPVQSNNSIKGFLHFCYSVFDL